MLKLFHILNLELGLHRFPTENKGLRPGHATSHLCSIRSSINHVWLLLSMEMIPHGKTNKLEGTLVSAQILRLKV